jgi:transitional endoplasmic reticulum ATPase
VQHRYEIRSVVQYLERLVDAISSNSPVASVVIDWAETNDHVLGVEIDMDIASNSIRRRGHQIRRTKKIPKDSWQEFMRVVKRRSREFRSAHPSMFDKNIGLVSDYFRLDAIERGIFDIVCRFRSGGSFEDLCEHILGTHACNTARLLGFFLGVPTTQVQKRISGNARLLQNGLIVPDRDLHHNKLALGLASGLLEGLRPPSRCLEDVCRSLLGEPADAALLWEDFHHIASERDFIADIIAGGRKRKREKGINILLYGRPGTGKTELCKTLAKELGLSLYMVGERDEDGGEPIRSERLSGIRLSQRLLVEKKDALLMFDEMEDLLSDDGGGYRRRKKIGSKAFVNRLLEENLTPTFWTCNDISSFDPAFLRRMTLAIELRIPPASVRERVWQRILDSEKIQIPGDEVRQLAREFEAAPAIAANAVRAARLAGGGIDKVRLAVRNIGKAVRGGRETPRKSGLDGIFDPNITNASLNLDDLTNRLSKSDSGQNFSLCLYGPPGTGKSAYTRFLADRMGLEVLHKRASDLISGWVGETEANIALAFAEARDIGAFLIIDEADSMLQDRSGARQSWEITQVNEMLTWMETHDKPFACTTNLMDRLDRASLRRFTFKIQFDYLSATQAAYSFKHYFGIEHVVGLDRIAGLTPGDFAVVSRRAKFLGCGDNPVELIAMLEEECEAKPDQPRPMGFLAA